MKGAGRPRLLDEVLADLRRLLSAEGFQCREVRCLPDGSLRLALARQDRGSAFLWTAQAFAEAPPGSGLPLCGFCFRPEHSMSKDDLTQAYAWARRRLEPLWDARLRDALGPRSREAREVERSADGVARLFADCLVPGTGCWGDYEFSGFSWPQDRKRPALRAAFSRRGKSVVFALPLAEAQAGRRGLFGPALILKDERTAGERGQRAHQVEQALFFWLGRCLRPGMSWAGPAGGESRPRTLKEFAAGSLMPHELGEDIFFGSWGNNFISNELLLRSPGSAQVLYHGNRECAPGAPLAAGNEDLYHFSPWSRACEDLSGFRCTDFDDEAAALGGEGRLCRALAQSAGQAAGRPVYVTQTCEYACLAEDLAGVVERERQASGAEVAAMDIYRGPANPLSQTENKWDVALRARLARRAAGEADPCGVHLVGLGPPDSPGLAELEAMLASLGVKVYCRLFPYLDWARLDSLGKARLWVMSPWAPVQQALRGLLQDSGDQVVTLPSPYGVRGTAAWARGILEALGQGKAAAARAAALARKPGQALAALAAQARGQAAGFAAPQSCVRELSSPEFFYGFDPLAFLKELGWRCVVLRTRCQAKPKESLAQAMRRAPCSLFYTDWPADSRVAAAGKTPFSVRHMEPGFAGALRTARRLLRRGRAPFFPRYARYLDGGQT